MKALLSKHTEPEYVNCPKVKEQELLCPERELEVLFIRTFHTIEGAIKKELRRKGIAPKIAAMVAEIYRFNNPSPIELARISNRKPQTITAIVNRMEKKGLVKRVTNERKKNTYSIHLTEKGLLTYQKILKIDVFNRVTQNFSEENLIQLRAYLEELSIQANKLSRKS